jgi:antitoxin component HigA of HigAB toxin-antitoxin module
MHERARWPRWPPKLSDLLTYLMGQHGLSRAALALLIEMPRRISEVLNGKRQTEHVDGA